eukprot:gene1609-1871_t
MESIGAVYSRISTHIFGDWNACGKVMGLASWSGKTNRDLKDWYFSGNRASTAVEAGHDGNIDAKVAADTPINFQIGSEYNHPTTLISGNPYDGSMR